MLACGIGVFALKKYTKVLGFYNNELEGGE